MRNCFIPNYQNPIKKLYNLTGAFCFNDAVEAECIDRNPVGDRNNRIYVNFFYSFFETSKCSLFTLLSEYKDQLPEGYLPICDGEPGDLICISLKAEDHGKIYYWHHESPPNNDLFLITDSFEDFFFKIAE
ncbi:MAG: SMI1/KNR4 family protein [Bacteroidota bacterium]